MELPRRILPIILVQPRIILPSRDMDIQKLAILPRRRIQHLGQNRISACLHG